MESRRLGKQALECLGMLMIGDGLLTALQVDRHLRLWRGWSKPLDRAIAGFLKHPELTQMLGLAELAAGVAIASFQTPQPAIELSELRVPISDAGAEEFEEDVAPTRL